MNVLLVEDDASLSDGIARILLGAGYAVEARSSGSDALEATRSRRFDLMPSEMPESEGMSRSIASSVSSLRCGSLWRLIDQIATPSSATTARSRPRIQAVDAGSPDTRPS